MFFLVILFLGLGFRVEGLGLRVKILLGYLAGFNRVLGRVFGGCGDCNIA